MIFRSFVVEPFKSYKIFAIYEKHNFANLQDISYPLTARFLQGVGTNCEIRNWM